MSEHHTKRSQPSPLSVKGSPVHRGRSILASELCQTSPAWTVFRIPLKSHTAAADDVSLRPFSANSLNMELGVAVDCHALSRIRAYGRHFLSDDVLFAQISLCIITIIIVIVMPTVIFHQETVVPSRCPFNVPRWDPNTLDRWPVARSPVTTRGTPQTGTATSTAEGRYRDAADFRARGTQRVLPRCSAHLLLAVPVCIFRRGRTVAVLNCRLQSQKNRKDFMTVGNLGSRSLPALCRFTPATLRRWGGVCTERSGGRRVSGRAAKLLASLSNQ